MFDPRDHLNFSSWPEAYQHSKVGLVGGHLNIANVGAYTPGHGGFELIAFSPGAADDGTPFYEINYAPTVLVRLREEAAGARGEYRYFVASNDTAATSTTPDAFYGALLRQARGQRALLRSSMSIELPGPEGARQRDTALFGLLSALNNYVGLQANYGFGATYWSYGREDNGSLPLNVLSVDSALLEWGACEPALAHLDFYFGENIRDDGTVRYDAEWEQSGDSIGDIGRLTVLYLRAQELCYNAAWVQRHLPRVRAMGARMAALAVAAAANVTHDGCEGMVRGPPEHDWFAKKDDCFFNNNVWLVRGMDELGAYLLEEDFGAQLLGNASALRNAVKRALDASEVHTSDGGLSFMPPNGIIGAEPYESMTESYEASYSNFRFWSEAILADVLPRVVESTWLRYHNERGGRLGGANRFEERLDDMPSAGWGYGALTNNRTADFLALLVGPVRASDA